MNNVSIVVASKYRDIFDQCREPIEDHYRDYRKFVVVDDPEAWKQPGWQMLQAPLPFRGMAPILNVGLKASVPDDVLWIQDDVTVLSADLLEVLRHVAYEHPQSGPVSPVVVGEVGNNDQKLGIGCEDRVIESSDRLAFMCIYFRRDILDVVGLMDERFWGFGCDDRDWCRRAQLAGYKLLVARSVKVRHGFGDYGSAATAQRRDGPNYTHTFPEMQRLYRDKWRDG